MLLPEYSKDVDKVILLQHIASFQPFVVRDAWVVPPIPFHQYLLSKIEVDVSCVESNQISISDQGTDEENAPHRNDGNSQCPPLKRYKSGKIFMLMMRYDIQKSYGFGTLTINGYDDS